MPKNIQLNGTSTLDIVATQKDGIVTKRGFLNNNIISTDVDGYLSKYSPIASIKTSNLVASNLTPTPGYPTQGACEASNGSIYFSPRQAGFVIKMTLTDGDWVCDGTSIDVSTYNRGGGWWGCTEANKKIYFSPSIETSNLLVVDTANSDAVSIIDLNSISTRGWIGAITINNLVYFMPSNSDVLLIVDSINDTFTTVPLPGVPSSPGTPANGCHGGVYSSINGLIYGIPSAKGYYIVIDPSTNVIKVVENSKTALLQPLTHWGGCESSNGDIFMADRTAGGTSKFIPIINVNAKDINDLDKDTLDTTSVPLDKNATFPYEGCCMMPNGMIYFGNQIGDGTLILNPTTKEQYNWTPSIGNDKFSGPIVSRTGQVVVGPNRNSTSNVFVIDSDVIILNSISTSKNNVY